MFGKKRIAALTGAIMMTLSAGVFAAQAPTGLQSPTLSTDEDSTWLCWDRPAKGDDAQYYNIYCNGKKIGTTQTPVSTWGTNAMEKFRKANPALCGDLIIYHSYEAKGLKPSTEYTFTVRAVGKDGKESKDSKALKVKTTAVPKVVNAKDFGAKGDGKTLDTKALQKAIDATPKDGVLLIPAGTFVSGSLDLKGDMTLKLDKGATLLSVNDINGFRMQKNNRYDGMLNVRNAKNLRIVGQGTIDGNGWMKDKKGNYYKAANVVRADGKKSREPDVRAYGILAKTQTEYLMDKEGRNFKDAYVGRSSTVMLHHVDNLYIEGVTMCNPSLHMVVINYGNDVTVNNVNFLTYDVNNGDVIDYTGRGYKVMNCYMDSGDDSVNFNAGMGEAAKGKAPVGDAWVFNNYTKHAHGGVTLGSHTGSWIENILGEDNIYEQTEVPFRCKTSEITGGGGRNVIFRHNVMKNIKNNAFLFTTNYTDEFAIGKFKATNAGVFHDMLVEDCVVQGTKKATFKIYGMPGAEHYNITLRNVKIINGKKQELKDYKNVVQENVTYVEDKNAK
ncbi:MAG: glycoside hydrolase family 28 protein [Selenomonadaceae bacterium]|nr:glycoside hydrolase family 28 protein [Selenomonadaceae bacterium]